MTSYWDGRSRAVSDASAQHRDPLEFLKAVERIEADVIQTVSYCTGDREFPDDLRERIMTCIAVKALNPVPASTTFNFANEDARDYCESVRASELISDLHSIFHDVARRRPPHRFGGFFSDDPSGFLHIREEALKEQEENGT